MSKGRDWYKEQLSKPEWMEFRQQVYARDEYACVDCGEDGVRLHCHHEYYVRGKLPWEYPLHALATVCDDCHDKRHKHFSKIPHATQEDADMWVLFSEVERHMLEDHLKERDARIRWLEDRGAVWENEGRFWGFVDKKGRDRFFDEDGNSM